jgi:hypothetical protein
VPGFIDFLTITDRAAKRVAIFHLVANVAALVLFAVSFWLSVDRDGRLRADRDFDRRAGVAQRRGWFGGELVFVHNMGVTPPKEDSRQSVDPRTVESRSGLSYRRRARGAPPDDERSVNRKGRLRASRGDEQDDPAHERGATEDRRQRNRLFVSFVAVIGPTSRTFSRLV